MKKTITTLTAVCCLAVANAQWWGDKTIKGNGKTTTQTRNVGAYDAISVAGSFQVELVAGREGEIKVEAEENLMEYIETRLKEETLKIRTKEGIRLKPGNGHPIRITVPFETISRISLAGSGNVTSKQTVKADKLVTNLAGSGDITLAVSADTVKGSLAGSGNLKLTGAAANFDCDIAGSGNVEAADLKAEDVSASIAGSGKAEVYCTDTLKARITGSGDVVYKGSPQKEDSKVTGSGKVRKM